MKQPIYSIISASTPSCAIFASDPNLKVLSPEKAEDGHIRSWTLTGGAEIKLFLLLLCGFGFPKPLFCKVVTKKSGASKKEFVSFLQVSAADLMHYQGL